MNTQQDVPPMVVQKLDGKVERTARRYVVDKEMSTPEKKRYMMQESIERIDAGYLVTFPRKGHSIRVDQAELDRLVEKLNDPNGFVESEKVASADMAQVMRAAGGNSLVTVIQEGVAK